LAEILAVKMGILSEKDLIQKSWSANKFSAPLKLGARSPPLDIRLHGERGSTSAPAYTVVVRTQGVRGT